MRTQTTRTIAGRVNADGSIAGGSDFTSRRTATGSYSIVVAGRVISATVIPAASAYAMVSGFADRTFNVLINSLAQTAVDMSFNFVAVVAT